jgi:CheY-like chemotaxis protein
LGQRQHKRYPLRSQVRIFGADSAGRRFSRLAETVDVSQSGARLSGIFLELRVGDQLAVQAESGLGVFRVVWQGQIGTERAGEVAIRSIDSVVLWPSDDGSWEDTFDPATSARERRFYRRFDCDLSANITPEGELTSIQVRCADLSFGGCYVEMVNPLPEGAKLSVSVTGPVGPPLQAAGYVQTTYPHFGMGVRFNRVEDPKVLAALLDGLRKRTIENSRSVTVLAPALQNDSELCGRTVLVVDDSLSVRNMISHNLRRHGYSVVLAKDGEEALRTVKTCRPDLILLDILLPRLSGLAVLRKLKTDSDTQDIPVVVISSLSEDNDARVLAEGACGYIAKATTTPDKIPAVLDRAFQHLSARRPMSEVVAPKARAAASV